MGFGADLCLVEYFCKFVPSKISVYPTNLFTQQKGVVMPILQINVSNELAESVNLSIVQTYLEHRLRTLALGQDSDIVRRAIEDHRETLDEDFDHAKTEAWKEYKSQYLKGLPV